ncbi:lysylphosphatidylglycerol synthase transmembrane domain-containing protein [Rhodohalobacter barkolensis]|uniref:TIGR00374 family protein n=1 Tax=Rhodohalobacter barkolensis TaxID=2053187 RepID=A0A2N0VGT3_9BACT|nr:lysylphosphatidylglycerol synthase transmembrane domain-containing protein [Rhodohalobacter barkolensis]PKD43390.1 TIGR00374 family protein [Rhodohalobacter barkolensis]
MKKRRFINILISVVVAALFIQLAVRNVDMSELWQQMKMATFYWLPFFVLALLASHIMRAERWRLLLENENERIPRSTLFAGVMLGYVLNNVVPRLGEISRPVYVARKQGMSSSNLIGTIVVERLFDLATMMLLVLFVSFYLIRDAGLLEQLFGTDAWPWYAYLAIPLFFVLAVAGIWLIYKILNYSDEKEPFNSALLNKILDKARSFTEGMISIRHVKNWPMFLLLTAGIWIGYVFMTYLPFYMMSFQSVYGLTMSDAVVLTMVSSIGVSIPTPAGIGSYHLLIQQSMWLLYNIPLVSALTYATIAHAVTVLLVFIIGPISLWWDKYATLKAGNPN